MVIFDEFLLSLARRARISKGWDFRTRMWTLLFSCFRLLFFECRSCPVSQNTRNASSSLRPPANVLHWWLAHSSMPRRNPQVVYETDWCGRTTSGSTKIKTTKISFWCSLSAFRRPLVCLIPRSTMAESSVVAERQKQLSLFAWFDDAAWHRKASSISICRQLVRDRILTQCAWWALS